MSAAPAAVACYVSGAGMFAGDATRAFKSMVMLWLEDSGLGFDTRYRYYRARLPGVPAAELATRVCDPIEYYDPDWPEVRDACARAGKDPAEALARFVVERDSRFRDEAAAAAYCFDEAGLGSGINVMRFVQAGKTVFGFYAEDEARRRVNLTNVLQLAIEFPALVRLAPYRDAGDIQSRLAAWLSGFQAYRPIQ